MRTTCPCLRAVIPRGLVALSVAASLLLAAPSKAEPQRAGDDARALAFALSTAEIASPAMRSKPRPAGPAMVPVPTATLGLLPPGIRPTGERIALTSMRSVWSVLKTCSQG